MTEALTTPRPLKILLTGFGPFRTHVQNASFEIIRRLAARIPVDDSGREIELVVHPEPVRVSYEAVGTLMSQLFSTHPDLDFVIQLGVAARLQRAEFVIEQIAHRTGFTSTDVDGFIGDEILKKPHWAHWNAGPESLHTSINVNLLIHHVQQHIISQPMSLKPSEDAGRYLCEFIYYNSLLHFHGQSQSGDAAEESGAPGRMDGKEKDEQKRLPVIFLHVPIFVEEPDLELGATVVRLIIKSIVDLYLTDPKNSRYL